MTGERVSTSVSLEADIKEWLDQHPDLNRSAIVNEVLREYRDGGRRPDGVKLRMERLRSEIEDLEDELEAKRSELEALERKQQQREEALDPIVDEVGDMVMDGRTGILDVEHSIIRAKARKAGVQPGVLVEAVVDHLDGKTWVESSSLQSRPDRELQFDRQRWDAGQDPFTQAVADGGDSTDGE